VALRPTPRLGRSWGPNAPLRSDAGAARALREKGSSLLAVGVREVHGRFPAGSPVRVLDTDGNLVGVGLSNFDHQELATIAGLPSRELRGALGREAPEEVIHRDHFVLLESA